jgi:hypothetical protein
MAVSNHLLLSTKAEEDSKDDLLSALSNIAYAIPETSVARTVKPPVVVRKKRNRFFYKPTRSFDSDVQERKEAMEPKSALDYINTEVDERIEDYRDQLPPVLSKNIEVIREFFLNEIDPLVLGVQGGLAQAQDVVQKTLESAVDPAPFAQFERMVAHARLYKMATFIAKYMKLPKSAVDDLLYAVQPKKEVMIIGPHADERGGPRRHERVAAGLERNRKEAAMTMH